MMAIILAPSIRVAVLQPSKSQTPEGFASGVFCCLGLPVHDCDTRGTSAANRKHFVNISRKKLTPFGGLAE